GLKPRVSRPVMPATVEGRGLFEGSTLPQLSEHLLDGPRAPGLQVKSLEGIEGRGLVLGNVLLAVEPEVAGARQRLVAFRAQSLGLSSTDDVHCAVHVCHDVKSVE